MINSYAIYYSKCIFYVSSVMAANFGLVQGWGGGGEGGGVDCGKSISESVDTES